MALTRAGFNAGPGPQELKGQLNPNEQQIMVNDSGGRGFGFPVQPGILPENGPLPTIGSLSALTGPLTELAGGDQDLLQALLAGLTSAEMFFSPGSLGRVNEIIAPQEIKFHNQLEQQAASAGGRTQAAQQALDLLRGQTTQGMTPEMQKLLQQRQQEVDFARKGDPNLQRALAQRQAEVDFARKTDPNLAAALERRRGGLEGLNAQENQALREQGTSALNRGFQSALRGVAQGRAGSGVSGPAAGLAFAPVTGQFLDAQRGLERDVLLANVDEKNRRLREFEGLAGDMQGRRFSQTQQALGGFEGLAGDIQARRFGQTQQALGGLEGLRQQSESDVFNRQQQARQAFEGALFQREQAELGDRRNAFDRFVNFQRDLDLRLLDRQRINLNLLEKEKAGQAGTIFGFGGFRAAQEGRQTAEDIARQQIEASKDIARIQADAFAGGFPSGPAFDFGSNPAAGLDENDRPRSKSGFNINQSLGEGF